MCWFSRRVAAIADLAKVIRAGAAAVMAYAEPVVPAAADNREPREDRVALVPPENGWAAWQVPV